jgi:hypothetical protein
MLDKKPGPCRMAISNVKYYFDKNMKKCLPFEYGGCRGIGRVGEESLIPTLRSLEILIFIDQILNQRKRE